MTTQREAEKILKALANKRRLSIVVYLGKTREAKVGDIADKIKLSFKATSKHLALLYSADIVDKEQRSLEMWYKLSPSLPPLAKLISNSLE